LRKLNVKFLEMVKKIVTEYIQEEKDGCIYTSEINEVKYNHTKGITRNEMKIVYSYDRNTLCLTFHTTVNNEKLFKKHLEDSDESNSQ